MSASNSRVALALLASLAAARSAHGQELYRLSIDAPKPHLDFGWSLAADGDLLVVGSPYHGFLFAGARVVRASTGGLVAELSTPVVEAADTFGASVALDGDLVAVGAPKRKKRGAAYVYSASTGALLRVLTPVDGNQRLGTSIAFDGGTVVVGDPAYYPLGGSRAGGVHVFDVATGLELHRLVGPVGAPTEFGTSVAVGGGRVLVGAPLEPAVHVFDLASGAELYVLEPGPPLVGYVFGTSVAIDGDLGLVGSPVNSGPQGGSAHLYDLASGQELRTLLAPQPQWDNSFGVAVDLADGRAVVGASRADAAKPQSGTAYVFDAATGELLQRLAPADGAKDDRFGAAVALADGVVAVGAPQRDTSEKDAGRVHAYCGAWPVGAPYCGPAAKNSTGGSAVLRATGCDFVRANHLRLEAAQLPPDQLGLFLASLTPGFVPFYGGSQGHLCLGGTFGRVSPPADSGIAGQLTLHVDLDGFPPPLPPAVQAGETWYFQAIFRDRNPGPTSNLTDGLEVAFR